jgi:hypothetical protein
MPVAMEKRLLFVTRRAPAVGTDAIEREASC